MLRKFHGLNCIPRQFRVQYEDKSPIGCYRVMIERPLKVVGIVGATWIDSNTAYYGSRNVVLPMRSDLPDMVHIPRDPNVAHRSPEYFMLFEEDSNGLPRELARGRWDNLQPKHYAKYIDWQIVSYGSTPYALYDSSVYLPMYEVLFDTSFVMDRPFYVGMSFYNNYYIDTNCIPDGECSTYSYDFRVPRDYSYRIAHPLTCVGSTDYRLFKKPYQFTSIQKLCKHMSRNTVVDPCYNPESNYPLQRGGEEDELEFPCLCLDTVWQDVSFEEWRGGITLFPKFDTTFNRGEEPPHIPFDTTTPQPDPCPIPTGLTFYDLGNNMVTILWNNNSAHTSYQLSYCRPGTDPNNGTLITPNGYMWALSDIDTNWYVAYVRAQCANGEWTEWSDGLWFRTGWEADNSVPQALEATTFIQPNPAHDRVQVFSSFQIRKLSLYDIQGRLVLTQHVNGPSATVSLTNIPTGFYILLIDTPSGTVPRRLSIR